MHSWWLFAKGADLAMWLRYLVPLIVFMFYALNQILNRERKGQPPKPSRSVPRRPPMPEGNAKRPPAPGRPATPQKTDPLLAEIQKFLKQSNPESARRSGPSLPPPSRCGSKRSRLAAARQPMIPSGDPSTAGTWTPPDSARVPPR